jgi:uncharacterized protein DUF4936
LNYYVYYKVAAEDVAKVRALVNELFQIVKSEFDVHGRWMRRRDDPTTYMEVYEGVQDEAKFEALMEANGARIAANRRLERFVSA